MDRTPDLDECVCPSPRDPVLPNPKKTPTCLSVSVLTVPEVRYDWIPIGILLHLQNQPIINHLKWCNTGDFVMFLKRKTTINPV